MTDIDLNVKETTKLANDIFAVMEGQRDMSCLVALSYVVSALANRHPDPLKTIDLVSLTASKIIDGSIHNT